MVARYSHSSPDPDFMEDTNKALRLLRKASDRCGRKSDDDLATGQRKRKQRNLLSQAIQAIESSQRKGMDSDTRKTGHAILTKQSLKKAVSEYGNVQTVAKYFNMSTAAISRTMRMFKIVPQDPQRFFSVGGV